MDYSFRLLVDFVSMCRSRQAHVKSFCGFFFLLRMCVHVHNTMTHSNKRQSTSRLENADEKKFQQEEQSVQEELTPFPSSPAAFVSYLTPICHPGQPRALQDHTELVHIRTQSSGRDLIILAADSGFYFGPCAMPPCDSSKVACMMFFSENHGTSSFQRRLTLLL